MTDNKNTDGQYWSEHQLVFTEKRFQEHIKNYLKILISETPAFIALFITIWAFSEILMEIVGDRVSTNRFFILTAVVSFVYILYKSFLRFLNDIPKLIKSESEASKNIVWWQKCGWQYDLARQILSERFEFIEMTLNRISTGSHFLPPKILPVEDYFEWLNTRPTVLKRLMYAVVIQCTEELPSVLGKTRTEKDLNAVLQSIDNLEALYKTSKDFEIECHQIIPPKQFEGVHEMTFGWTNPIRSGINKLLIILKNIAEYDIKSPNKDQEVPLFNIVFEAPDNINEFCARLDSFDINNL